MSQYLAHNIYYKKIYYSLTSFVSQKVSYFHSKTIIGIYTVYEVSVNQFYITNIYFI